VAITLVALAVVTAVCVMLKRTRLLAGVKSKFVPLIVTAVPTDPIVRVKLVIVGGAPGAPTLITAKASALVVDPSGVVTAIGPEVAPLGTVVTIWVAVVEVTVAAAPLKVTVF
jgi:hypothetical protein